MTTEPEAGVGSRRHQMFPTLTESEIARVSQFGALRRYVKGERLFAAGEPTPGMFVVLQGHVTASQRDGMGHVVPTTTDGRGQFSGEVAQLSGRHALADGHADDDVEVVLIPPEQLRALIIAEADLGVETAAWLFIILAISTFLAMNFTGASTYTSLSGVKKEMRWAVPMQIGAGILGLGLWLGSHIIS